MNFEEWIELRFGTKNIHISESTLPQFKAEYEEFIKNHPDWKLPEDNEDYEE